MTTATETFPPFTDNAIAVMDRRYLTKDLETKLPNEVPDDMFDRVARNLAEADRNYGADDEMVLRTAKLFYGIMRRLDFLPNSPTLMNAGRVLQQLSACFVLPVEDSLDDIFTKVKSTALIHQSGGGTGFAFSRLRPAGDVVRSTGGVASGPTSFIRAFNVATDVVKQGGTRRGANMGVLSVYHPDVISYINSKLDPTSLENFNISIAVDEDFMEKARRGEPYQTVNPRTGEPAATLDASLVLNRIISNAWETGDPGLIFLDRINRDNPNPQLGEIESTNPCVDGNTVVATTRGPRTARELLGKQFTALVNGEEWQSAPEGFFHSGYKPVLRITTAGDHVIRVTEDHRMRTRTDEGDEWTPAGWVQPGDRLVLAGKPGTDRGIRRQELQWTADARGTAVVEGEITDTASCAADTVVAVREDGWTDVYDVQIPGINAFDGNGLYVHQCGEQPLLPYESCNLGSINLVNMLTTGDNPTFDEHKIRETARVAVHMLDNVIDMNEYPIEEIAEMTRNTRRIGVGVMGFADALIRMNIGYDSPEGVAKAREVMSLIQTAVHDASAELAETRGAFPAWEGSAYATGLMKPERPMRNSAPLTIAPTGTISIIAGVSSGIEPLFALNYWRTVMDGTRLPEVNTELLRRNEEEGFLTDTAWDNLLNEGFLPDDADVPEDIKRVFRTSQQISAKDHIAMQAAFQEFTDNAVSKTINMANNVSVKQVEDAYWEAYRLGCKGITVYRDGSKQDQVLSTGATSTNGHIPWQIDEQGYIVPRRRDQRELEGKTIRIDSGHGGAYITINKDENGNLFELFAAVGKAGACDDVTMHALTRVISTAVRSGTNPEELARQLRGHTCCPIWDHGQSVKSIPDAIGLAIQRSLGVSTVMDDDEPLQAPIQVASGTGRRPCPECGDNAVLTGGCLTCYSCGWSKCE